MDPMLKLFLERGGKPRRYHDDRIYRVAAFGPKGETLDLTGLGEWEKPEGKWTLAVCGLSRNLGPHRSYINMMDAASCRVLIDAVYEPHYARYRRYFGSTLAGFFSDEPELGNGILYAKRNRLGTDQDLPWSRELQALLEERYGERLFALLPSLFTQTAKGEEIAFRLCYMDCVTKLVRRDFSLQIGDWCHAHGVEYIGHTVEDGDTHSCTGSGLGHFFRAMAGQDMAGIDDIGGQVLPQGEDGPTGSLTGERRGAFYHFTLAKLGVSLASLDGRKHGRCMCEIFGNYGWGLGVTDMKYLADHFLVRGVNYFVPHAFSPKAYPDPDCPPHFYAGGNDPQFRHFGALCRYMDRVCALIDGGEIVCDIAVYYHAESDWAGECEPLDVTARALTEHQIDFCFLPLDRLDLAERFRFVIVPKAEYVPPEVLALPNRLLSADYPGEKLVAFLREQGVGDALLSPGSRHMRVLHYRGKEELYFFVNEGTEPYRGEVSLPVTAPHVFRYDAWGDRLYPFRAASADGGSRFALTVYPRKSVILFFSREDRETCPYPEEQRLREVPLRRFRRSVCRAIDYPRFGESVNVTLPDEVEKELPSFSGFIRYEADIPAPPAGARLKSVRLTGLTEGVELFVNGKSAGLQIVPDYVFDVEDLVRSEKNRLTVECATTLLRENRESEALQELISGVRTPLPDTGIHGEVLLCYEAEREKNRVKHSLLQMTVVFAIMRRTHSG